MQPPNVPPVPERGGFGPSTDFPVIPQDVPQGTMPAAPALPAKATKATAAAQPLTTPPPYEPPKGFVWIAKGNQWSMVPGTKEAAPKDMTPAQKATNDRLMQAAKDRKIAAFSKTLEGPSGALIVRKKAKQLQAKDKSLSDEDAAEQAQQALIDEFTNKLDAAPTGPPSARSPAAASTMAEALPLPAKTTDRRPGATYQTPQGPAQWTGKGWILVHPDEEPSE
jgi:hypothetical protein